MLYNILYNEMSQLQFLIRSYRSIIVYSVGVMYPSWSNP
jgi:hypothetical protein